MSKNTLIPSTIIIFAVVISGIVLFLGSNDPTSEGLEVTSNNLRTLELAVPSMFCAGCTASVEGYISSMSGVKRVKARLTPIKSATVVYDSDVVTKEEIIKNQVFELYGVSVISDNTFSGSVLPTESKGGSIIPQEIQDKSRQVALLIQQKSSEGKKVNTAQSLFNQVNSDIEQGNFPNATVLLDTIINLLQNL